MLHSRKKRLENLIREEVALIIEAMKDPRLDMVTVSEARMSNDLKTVNVFVSVLEDQRRQALMDALEKARGFIKKELGSRIVVKYMPDIIFRYDESFNRAARIDQLLRTIHEETPEDPTMDNPGGNTD